MKSSVWGVPVCHIINQTQVYLPHRWMELHLRQNCKRFTWNQITHTPYLCSALIINAYLCSSFALLDFTDVTVKIKPQEMKMDLMVNTASVHVILKYKYFSLIYNLSSEWVILRKRMTLDVDFKLLSQSWSFCLRFWTSHPSHFMIFRWNNSALKLIDASFRLKMMQECSEHIHQNWSQHKSDPRWWEIYVRQKRKNAVCIFSVILVTVYVSQCC